MRFLLNLLLDLPQPQILEEINLLQSSDRLVHAVAGALAQLLPPLAVVLLVVVPVLVEGEPGPNKGVLAQCDSGFGLWLR